MKKLNKFNALADKSSKADTGKARDKPEQQVDVEEIFDLASAMEDIMGQIPKVTIRVETGNGMAPETRRKLILSKKTINSAKMSFFAAVHLRRGSNWRLYSEQNNEIQSEYRTHAAFFGISVRKNDKGVTSQVIANCFADVMICFRGRSPLIISGEQYNDLDQKYQWVGSLGSIYNDLEEDDPEAAWAMYLVNYILFMEWYVEVTGKLTGKEKSKDSLSVEDRVLNGCHFARQAWDLDTRRAWSSGNYSIKPKSSKQRVQPMSDEMKKKFKEGLALEREERQRRSESS